MNNLIYTTHSFATDSYTSSSLQEINISHFENINQTLCIRLAATNYIVHMEIT